MVKKSFLKVFIGVVLAMLLMVGVSSAKSLQWDQNPHNICFPEQTCGNYVYVWTLATYCSIMPGDCTYVGYVKGAEQVFIPHAKQTLLEQEGTYTLKVKVLPESYETTSIKLSKKNFPLPYESEFVTVVVAYEKNGNGPELESAFSNRIMFRTPKKLSFGISIQAN